MKHHFFLFFLFSALSVTILHGQKKYTLDNVSSIYIKSTGAIIQKNVVKGYYFLYETDQISRKQSKYNLAILDQNLNKVKEIEFEDSKEIRITESSFNGNSFGFIFKNEKKSTREIRVYDMNGVQTNSFTRKSTTEESFTSQMIEPTDGTSNQQLADIGETGFAEIITNGTANINFLSCKSKVHWTYRLDRKIAAYGVSILGATDGNIIIAIQGRKTKFDIEAINLENGEKSYESSVMSIV